MIRVLLVEDSSTVREALARILESDDGIAVVGRAADGAEGIQLTERLKPDLIVMDVNMPVLNGLEATKEIMVRCPTPILITSATTELSSVELSMSATQAGALAVLPKPGGPENLDAKELRREWITMVKALAGVKLIRRWTARGQDRVPASNAVVRQKGIACRAIGIGASTGGPPALRRILMDLPRDFPVPVLVVQHMSSGFLEGFAQWLAEGCLQRVKLPSDGNVLEAGTVYIAPDNLHMGVGAGDRVTLRGGPEIEGFRPSATYLLESLGRAYGPAAVGLILTGMGRDGADGARVIKEGGGHVLAQDEETSVVFGMAKRAIEEGSVDEVVPLEKIPERLVQLTTEG